MALKKTKVINQNITSATTISGSVDFNGVTPKRITILANMTKAGSGSAPGNATLAAQISPDGGITLLNYIKLYDSTGTDTPVPSVTISANGATIVSFAPEDVVDYVNVKMTVASADANNYWETEVWVIAEY